MSHREAIRRDALIIADQAKWAFQSAYSKAGRGLEAERGTDTSRSERDKLSGPTYDLELGDHRAREAYHHATEAVSLADVMLSGHLLGEGVTTQPSPVKLGPYATPHDLEQAVRRITWRCDQITADDGLNHVRRLLDKTVRALSRALDHGPVTTIGEPLCRTCTIRPQAQRPTTTGSRPTKAGECDTCATWRGRNGGPRPKTLDDRELAGVAAARAAQVRRHQRGQGWGSG